MILDAGFYLTQNEAGDDLARAVNHISSTIIEAKDLGILLQTLPGEFQRTACLPTSLAVAVNLLCQRRVFGLGGEAQFNVGHILKAAVLTHINDRVGEEGEVLEKGFPSIDRRTGNFYHTFLLGLAIRFGLYGCLLENLLETEKLKSLVKAGAVVLVSLDNLFVPQVSGKGRGITKLRVGRHVVLLHGLAKENGQVEFIYSDVFNPKLEDGLVPINLQVTAGVLN